MRKWWRELSPRLQVALSLSPEALAAKACPTRESGRVADVPAVSEFAAGLRIITLEADGGTIEIAANPETLQKFQKAIETASQ